MRRRTLMLTTMAAALGMIAVLAGPVRGQEPPRGDLTTALLVEMRALRGAIEQLASSNARIQLAIGRLQIQEQRVNALLQQQVDVRQKLAEAERLYAQDEARLADLIDAVATISEPGERQAVVAEIGALKMTVSSASAALLKMRSDEAELAGLVSGEQGRWNVINQELDALDEALRRQ